MSLYNNQETEITIIDEPKEIEFNFNNSKVPEYSKKNDEIDEIEKDASENIFQPAPREWQTSGPFEIDRSRYLLGEKIFIRIGELGLDEKGQIAFLRPVNETHVAVFGKQFRLMEQKNLHLIFTHNQF